DKVGGRAGFSAENYGKITAPATDLARKWDGWGTSLKPSHEPIIVVRKPLIDADTGRKLTVADCVEKYGTGAINIDASRISMAEEDFEKYRKKRESFSGVEGVSYEGRTYNLPTVCESEKVSATKRKGGRFPANCITLDSDEFYSKYFNVARANVTPNVSPAELSKKASKKDRNSDWQGEEIALEEKRAGVMHGSKTAVLNDSGKTPYNRNN